MQKTNQSRRAGQGVRACASVVHACVYGVYGVYGVYVCVRVCASLVFVCAW